MTGELLTAHDALEVGLVNRVAPDGEAVRKAMRVAHRLANGPAFAIQSSKTAVNEVLRFYSNLILPTSLAAKWVSMGKPDHAEVVQAIQGLRQPPNQSRLPAALVTRGATCCNAFK